MNWARWPCVSHAPPPKRPSARRCQGTSRKIHAAVVAAFGADGPEVLQCFPQGRGVFATSTDEALNNRLGQLVTGITPLSVSVGPYT